MLDGEGVTPERRQHGRIVTGKVAADITDTGGTRRRHTRVHTVHIDMDARWVEACLASTPPRLTPIQGEAAAWLERKFRTAGYGGSPRSCLDFGVGGGEQSDGSAARQAQANADVRTAMAAMGLEAYTVLLRCLAHGEAPRERRPQYREWQLIVHGLDVVAERFIASSQRRA